MVWEKGLRVGERGRAEGGRGRGRHKDWLLRHSCTGPVCLPLLSAENRPRRNDAACVGLILSGSGTQAVGCVGVKYGNPGLVG